MITWQHPRTKALLLRGAGYHGKGVMGMLKGHPTATGKVIWFLIEVILTSNRFHLHQKARGLEVYGLSVI